jgi:crotonobetainyl-CoA:carnitine CoA-transferase CaiB-like acyl-CoA transferase
LPDVLEGIRVVDLTTGPVGGFASMVLADFGADVIKIEPPGGDRFRALAASPLWLRGKRSAVLDLKQPSDRERAHGLLASADVVVVSGPSTRAARLGVDAETAERLQPSVVHCSISGWGSRGSYAEQPAYEGLVAARAGRMRVLERQLRRDGPVFAAVPIATHAAAQGAVQGIAAALFARARTGRGQRVETSLLQGLLPYDLMELLVAQLAERSGEQPPQMSHMGGDLPTLNYHPLLTRDGRWIQCGNLLEHLFLSFLEAIDLLGPMLADARFQSPPGSWDEATVEAARDRILLRVREQPVAHWMQAFRRNGNVAAEPYLSTREALEHPDLLANAEVVTLHDPDHGAVRQIGALAELGITPASPTRPAPRIGEHTQQVLAEPRPAPRFTPRAASAAGRPLEGIQVLEIATIIAAPLATTMLSDLGARVIKVEGLDGDPYRHLLPAGLTGVKTNAGKESICVDLKSAEGREIVQALASRADVLVHNFRPGVTQRLGIDYAQLAELNPGLVWVSVNGYGPHGPDAPRPSTHPVPGAAMGGAGYQAGPALHQTCESLEQMREISRQLMRANESNPDPNTAVVAASAAAAKPERPPVDAELMGLGPCYRLYPTRSGWVFLALTQDAEWARFCRAVRRQDLAHEVRFASAAARQEHADELIACLTDLFGEHDADDWERALLAAGVGCVRADGPSPGTFFQHDPHVLDNDFCPVTRHARFGEYRRWGPLVHVGGPAGSYGPGALAGDHTDALLDELGYTVERIAALREARVVASEPIAAGPGVGPWADQVPDPL